MKNRKPVILALLLSLAIGNYARVTSDGNIRTIEFLSIFVIGMLSGLLFQELMKKFRDSN